MVDHLRGVRDSGYRLALLTNNVREWEPRLPSRARLESQHRG
jgi:hypothetical protein